MILLRNNIIQQQQLLLLASSLYNNNNNNHNKHHHHFNKNHQHYSLTSSININSTFSTVKQQITQLHNQNKSKLYNVPPKILELVDKRLLMKQGHPLAILKEKIVSILGKQYHVSSDINPIVTPWHNFDVLRIPKEHISRAVTDTFYITEDRLLRTHTSAHQYQHLKKGLKDFVVFGDVYRRDQIDRYHYPAFHQMEAVSMLGKVGQVTVQQAERQLKNKIQNLAKGLFGNDCQMRWIQAYFPFTEPSFELELYFDGKWVQMLGCGVIHKQVLQSSNRHHQIGWAAGLGLQRFAMRLFNIPDVRLFWSQDQRFLSQFKSGEITEFKQFSKYPACFKDISMWINQQIYNPNDLFEIIRQIGGDLIEIVQQVDNYRDKKSNRLSKTYKICFRSLQRTLTNQQITKYQFAIRDAIQDQLSSVTLR